MSAAAASAQGAGTGRTVGYYVHHVGLGHARRAAGLAEELRRHCGLDVVGLSTLPRPAGWVGGWVTLPPDEVADPCDPSPGGRLHWAPRDHARTRERAAALSRWIAEAKPAAMISDVSVEVTLLARLHGVPVVAVALPGDRADAAHLLGFEVADAVVGFWPTAVTREVLTTSPAVLRRVVAVGGHSLLDAEGCAAGIDVADRAGGDRSVVALSGRGGEAWSASQLAAVRAATEPEGWSWTVLGEGSWVDDPREALRGADVVVTHAGQNAIADIAALRRPAVVVPAERPHREQRRTGEALAVGDWPVAVLPSLDHVVPAGWPALLDRVSLLPAHGWDRWCDGRAPQRFAQVVADVAGVA